MYKEIFVRNSDVQYIRDEELNKRIISFLTNKSISERELLEFISNPEIKRGIICEFTPNEFIMVDRLNFDYNNKVYEVLFDDEGIDLLYVSNYASSIIEIIIKRHFYYSGDITNEKFYKAALDLSKSYNYLLYRRKAEEFPEFYNYLIKNAKKYKDKILDSFLSLGSKIQIEVIKNAEITKDEIPYLISKLHNETIIWLMNNDMIDLYLLDTLALERLLARELNIPSHVINNPKFVNSLVNSPDIIFVRKILNLIPYLDIDNIVKKRRDYYDEQIRSYNPKYDMLDLFYKIYLYSNESTSKYDRDFRLRMHYATSKYENSAGKDEIRRIILSQKSKRHLSDMIIDYHFEEYAYNIFLDIKELLSFQKTTDNRLPEDRLNLYRRILSLDSLSYEEAVSLHEELKQYNVKEMFYDDMLFARNIIGESIEQNILTTAKLQKFKNEEKSNIYGVDVYELGGEDFFALVKSGGHYYKDYPFAYSYSLVGKNAIGVFGIESDGNTFVYDGVNKEQIVHIFPADSYTRYDEDEPSTKRVNMLMGPNELIENTDSFNELLIKEKGLNESDFDDRLSTLQKIAVYCFNTITEKHLKSAKENKIGILLINTKKYFYGERDELRGFPHGDYNYFRGEDILIGDFEENRDRFTRL